MSLLQVNGNTLEDITHEEAVSILKSTKEKVVIVVSRVSIFYGEADVPSPTVSEEAQSSKSYVSLTCWPFLNCS